MKILGIDWGEKKIGLAITEGEIARPLGVESGIRNQASPRGSARGELRIKKLCERENITKIVIGISEGRMAEKTREFGQELQKATGLPVEFFDETLTTHEAIKKMVESGTSQKKRREFHDAISAALILQGYLDNK